MTIAHLALGSNLGNRLEQLQTAIQHLNKTEGIRVTQTSPIYETEPWPKQEIKDGRPLEDGEQNWHLNQVVHIETDLSPMELLEQVQQIEKQMGKSPKGVWGSRIIDIDILLFGDENVKSDKLTVPHPFMHQRQFVLIPLLDHRPPAKTPHHRNSIQRLF